MFNKIYNNLYTLLVTMLVAKALVLGLLYTDAVLVTGLIVLIGLREYRADKKRLDYTQEVENRIKSLENKLAVMNMAQGKQKNPYMPGMPGM